MSLTTTAKGRHFEIEVEEWLKHLGYRDTKRNEKVRVSDDVKPYECDIHGHSYSVVWVKLRRLGIAWVALIWIYMYFDAGGLRSGVESAMTTFQLSANHAGL